MKKDVNPFVYFRSTIHHLLSPLSLLSSLSSSVQGLFFVCFLPRLGLKYKGECWSIQPKQHQIAWPSSGCLALFVASLRVGRGVIGAEIELDDG